MQQVPGWEQEGIISSTACSHPCGGASCSGSSLTWRVVLCSPSEEFHQGKHGSSFRFHTHTCLVKNSLLLSAHADHKVPLQVRPLSWAAGGLDLCELPLFTCSLPSWRLELGPDRRSSVFCTFASASGSCCSWSWSPWSLRIGHYFPSWPQPFFPIACIQKKCSISTEYCKNKAHYFVSLSKPKC